MAVMESQKLRIASKTENLALVENLVNEVCEEFHITEDTYGNILVAVTEAVNNAIQHGNKFDSQKNIDIVFAPKEGHLNFMVKDEGDGFEYDHLPDPTDPENLEKPHGRGVFLMRNLADEVEFEDKGRVVGLNFKL